MTRGLLTVTLAWLVVSGCAGRMNVDLLQARIRQQEVQLAESQREIAKTRSELKQSRLETERLKTEITQTTNSVDLASSTSLVQKVKINGLASGGLNKDDLPGDDMVVIQFTPLDSDNEPLKIPGNLEIVLIDPQLAQPDQQIDRWTFTSDDCQERWTRGITSSGYQFNLPLNQQPRHSNLIIELQYTTEDSRQFLTSQKIKVAIAPPGAIQQNNRNLKKRVQTVEEPDVVLPPVGDQTSVEDLENPSDWDKEDREPSKLTPSRAILHSSSTTKWADATGPVLR